MYLWTSVNASKQNTREKEEGKRSVCSGIFYIFEVKMGGAKGKMQRVICCVLSDGINTI